MTTPEGKVQSSIIKALRKCLRDSFTFKVERANVRGIPDLVCVWRGQTFFLEIKRSDGKGRLSRAQETTIARLITAGAPVFVVTSPEEAINKIKKSLSPR